ncbi:MAG: DUF1010 domain-containing protein [Simplicispira sp.]|nr:DUF1010 domain-containing protein [Simplicispira sp.]
MGVLSPGFAFGLRRFSRLFAASACAACAGSYRFVSIAPLLRRGPFRIARRQVWVSLLASVSNCSLQRPRPSLNSGVRPL